MAIQGNSNWLNAFNAAASAATGTLLNYWTGAKNPANPQSAPAETARKGEPQAKAETKPADAWYTQPLPLIGLALALLAALVRL